MARRILHGSRKHKEFLLDENNGAAEILEFFFIQMRASKAEEAKQEKAQEESLQRGNYLHHPRIIMYSMEAHGNELRLGVSISRDRKPPGDIPSMALAYLDIGEAMMTTYRPGAPERELVQNTFSDLESLAKKYDRTSAQPT